MNARTVDGLFHVDVNVRPFGVTQGVPKRLSDLGLSPTNRDEKFYLEGINAGVTVVKLLMDIDGPSGPMAFIRMDTVKVMIVYVDLDVNNDLALYGSVHGVGVNDGIDSVRFTIEETTSYDGYAENKTDPQVDGSVRNDDYSFTHYLDDRSELGTMVTGKTYTDFWCKDFGAAGVVKAGLIKDGVVVYSYNLRVPTDRDADGLADRWEREQIIEWNNQYAYSHSEYDLYFFDADDDWEMKDPDRTNTDGGTDMPEHKTTGDSLTALQEYRGFILDGGNGHTGGHKRLSVAKKELLVEVDIMDGVTHMPTEAGIRGIMDTVSGGFGDITDGAGINLYYVIDETAVSHKVFTSTADRQAWAANYRHKTNGAANMLSEFVYLVFADSCTAGYGGVANNDGAYVFVETVYSVHAGTTSPPPASLDTWLAYIAAHETTHLILDYTPEDNNDLNQNGVPDEDDDKQYLMYPYFNAQYDLAVPPAPPNPEYTADHIRFSNKTRSEIDLTSKQSVERT